MRKNKMMRLASALLVAVLLTTCAISGTFAKYVTSANTTDSARVAKWGVGISVIAETAFAEKYNDAASDAGTQVVSAVTTEDVLAPGTNGTLVTFEITGKPEVAVNLDANVDLELGAGWKYSDDSNYFPVVIKVGGVAVSYVATDDMETIEAAVETAILEKINAAAATVSGTGKNLNVNYDANSDELKVTTVTVTWEWAFDDNSATKDEADNITNLKDTYLGTNNTDATIEFSMDITVSQVN